jgi:hypothetical protein
MKWYVYSVTTHIVGLREVFVLILEVQIIYCDDSRYVDSGKRDPLFRKLYTDTSKLAISILFGVIKWHTDLDDTSDEQACGLSTPVMS